jgi:hypothetical protein
MNNSQNKTTETENSVTEFINTLDDAAKRADTFRIVELFKTQTGLEPKLWGPSIIGFGSYHYKYESGREGDAPLTGFSPRKDSFALYFAAEFGQREELLSAFGKHKTGKGCVYIKKLEDVDTEVLKKMIDASAKYIREKYS